MVKKFKVKTVYEPIKNYYYDTAEKVAKKSLKLYREGVRTQIFEYERYGLPQYYPLGDSLGTLNDKWLYSAFIVLTLGVSIIEDDQEFNLFVKHNSKLDLIVRKELEREYKEIKELKKIDELHEKFNEATWGLSDELLDELTWFRRN